jgi:hypothetical protein
MIRFVQNITTSNSTIVPFCACSTTIFTAYFPFIYLGLSLVLGIYVAVVF